VAKDTPLEKKVRELQNQKIKNREEVVRKLEKIDEALKAMENKLGRRTWLSPSRLEETIDKRLS
jgi:hypothetical protein